MCHSVSSLNSDQFDNYYLPLLIFSIFIVILMLPLDYGNIFSVSKIYYYINCNINTVFLIRKLLTS